MVYLVGVASPHVAIGTSALAVAANAASGLAQHARAGTVKWRCGFLYAGSGVVGALAGSMIGKAIDGQKLLFLFALLMLGVGVLMLRGRNNPGVEGAACNRHNAPKRSEEHTSELQSLMRISYAVFCLKNKKQHNRYN